MVYDSTGVDVVNVADGTVLWHERTGGEMGLTHVVDDTIVIAVSETQPMFGNQRPVLVLNRAERDVE